MLSDEDRTVSRASQCGHAPEREAFGRIEDKRDIAIPVATYVLPQNAPEGDAGALIDNVALPNGGAACDGSVTTWRAGACPVQTVPVRIPFDFHRMLMPILVLSLVRRPSCLPLAAPVSAVLTARPRT